MLGCGVVVAGRARTVQSGMSMAKSRDGVFTGLAFHWMRHGITRTSGVSVVCLLNAMAREKSPQVGLSSTSHLIVGASWWLHTSLGNQSNLRLSKRDFWLCPFVCRHLRGRNHHSEPRFDFGE